MLTFLIGWAVLSALLFVAMVSALRKFQEWHHAYLGALLVLVGLAVILLWHHRWLGVAIVALGDIILWDDGMQHVVQVVTRDPAYEAPLHRLWYYSLPGKSKWAVAVNAWLDHLLGRQGG